MMAGSPALATLPQVISSMARFMQTPMPIIPDRYVGISIKIKSYFSHLICCLELPSVYTEIKRNVNIGISKIYMYIHRYIHTDICISTLKIPLLWCSQINIKTIQQ